MTGRVLVVEDDDDLRRLLSLGLRAAGYEVEPHASAGPALRALADRSADVVVTDLRCPTPQDGRRVVQVARGARVPVVVVSGSDEDGDVGADAFLLKPVDLGLLAREIDRLLGAPQEGDAVAVFVAGNAAGVLQRAIASLEVASADDLPDVVHRLVGTLGSFGLPDAAAQVRSLVGASVEDAAAERHGVVAALRSQAGGA